MEKFKGTWLMIKTGDDYGEPEFIEFYENHILHFAIVTKKDEDLLEKSLVWKENLSDTKQEILDEKRIRIFRMGKTYSVISETESITEDTEYATDYEKIEPTKTSLSKEEILEKQFKAEWRGEKFQIVFNRDLSSPSIKEVNKRMNKEGRKILLENLQGTYFSSIFNDGRRETLIGMKEITSKKAVLFGFPEEPFEVIAYST